MSGLSFTSKITIAGLDELKRFFKLLLEVDSEPALEAKKTLIMKMHDKYPSSNFIGPKEINQISIEVSDGTCYITSEYPELYIDFFNDLMVFITNLGAQDYHARLFDSSSGGVQVWRGDDEEVKFEDKNISILGIDEEEGIHEALEENGASVTSEFSSDADIVVYAEGLDLSEFEAQFKHNIILIEEEEVWDYLEQGFG